MAQHCRPQDTGLRGIHPAILAEGGLRPAVRTLARRSAVPVRLDLNLDRRLPEQVEGSGLTGLRDRIEALGGTLEVTSPADSGTTLLIEIPV